MNKKILRHSTSSSVAASMTTASEKQLIATVKAASVAISVLTLMTLLTMTLLSL